MASFFPGSFALLLALDPAWERRKLISLGSLSQCLHCEKGEGGTSPRLPPSLPGSSKFLPEEGTAAERLAGGVDGGGGGEDRESPMSSTEKKLLIPGTDSILIIFAGKESEGKDMIIRTFSVPFFGGDTVAGAGRGESAADASKHEGDSREGEVAAPRPLSGGDGGNSRLCKCRLLHPPPWLPPPPRLFTVKGGRESNLKPSKSKEGGRNYP